MNYGTNSFFVDQAMVYSLLDYAHNRAIAWLHRTKTGATCFLGQNLIKLDIPEIIKFVRAFTFGVTVLDIESNGTFLDLNKDITDRNLWETLEVSCTITREGNSIRLTKIDEMAEYCASNNIDVCVSAVQIEFLLNSR